MDDKRILLLCIVIPAAVLSVAAGSAPPDALPEPSPPAVSDLDQQFLTRFVRRTLQQYLRDESLYESAYVPPGLRDLECHVLVTIWQKGFHRATGISERCPVLEACQEAALVAVTLLSDVEPVKPELLSRVTLEIEVVGDAAPLPMSAEALLAGPIATVIEPGIHGLVFQFGDVKKHLTPGEVVANNGAPRDAAFRLGRELTPIPERLSQAAAARFRTVCWVEHDPGGEVVELRRGLIAVAPEAVTPADLTAAAGRVADYLQYRRLPDGGFAYQFEPSHDAYAERDSLAANVGAAWALARHARHTGDADALAAADPALETWTRRIVDLRGVDGLDGAGFVRSPDGRHKLRLTALVCLALTDHPQADRFRPLRDKLVAGMLWLQRRSGEFVTAFPPTDVLGSRTVGPGEALLALACVYGERPQQRILVAFDRALTFYRPFFAEQPSACLAGWHVQAFARMARQAKRDDFAEFAYAMADALVEVQLGPDNCPWPDKWGGIAPYQPGDVGATTTGYLEGLAEALLLARHAGDKKRAQRYEQAVRSAARFVMQLEFRAEEAYYVRSPKDTVGGIRAAPSDNTIRLDHCHHALVALTSARDALFPNRDRSTK